MNYFMIGLRNIGKNRRRSGVTTAAIAFGFAAIALFSGYVKNVYDGLIQQAIRGELLGHLTVMKRGFTTEGKLHPAKYMFSKPELDKVVGILGSYRHTVLVTPRLSINGLMSNGNASTIFIAEGVVPADIQKLRGDFVYLSDTGIPSPDQMVITVGLRGMLAFEIEITGPKSDLHSGLHGGVLMNPLQALAELCASLMRRHNRIDAGG